MNKILKSYPFVALLAATHLSPLPQSAIALVLLLLGLCSLLAKHPRLKIPLALAYLFIIPLLFEPVLHLFSSIVAIPILPLIALNFRENALGLSSICTTKQRELAFTSKSVIAAAGAVILVSLLLGEWVLTMTSGMPLLLVAGMLIYISRRLPLHPLEVEQKEIRLVAGNTANLAIRVTTKTNFPLHIFVDSRYPWFRLAEDRLFNLVNEARLELTLTPSLSGPSEPELELFLIDPWGLTQTRQVVKPVRLYVIPRAKYAEWLARKYLEETASEARALAATFSPVTAGATLRGGVEYCDSRLYQPGDRLKDMDWKHTAKLREFVVKEYVEEARQTAIIAANLAAADAEEADRLVYAFISSALTLAKEAIPTAIAAYNQDQILAATPLLDARELVKKTLQLGQRVVLTAPPERYILPPDIKQLRVSLRQLKETTTEAAGKLREVLELERKAIEEAVEQHPATKALKRVSAHSLAPAMITVISALNHDNEALFLTLEELERQGYDAFVLRIH